jgi:hypothetical protein
MSFQFQAELESTYISSDNTNHFHLSSSTASYSSVAMTFTDAKPMLHLEVRLKNVSLPTRSDTVLTGLLFLVILC